ncbi:uncharacterized protein LOC126263120 isoform X1 [Schistocerca nitens]|uniref:uncharacterized protein LOC126263120 isoform X1 n=1 Tax=Schistocerca nitens TaxID=7011 RepID=UPI00211812D0|nr:uncharacterized protein LOC126263120 isoform X1 [Schistocerca nitens]
MSSELSGFLEVKVPSRVRKRGLTPWKAWRRQWCEARPADEEGAVELQFSATPGGGSTNTVHIPHGVVLCRSESRSRQFAFGVYEQPQVEGRSHSQSQGLGVGVGTPRRPSLFLATPNEAETQTWMAHVRALLARGRPLPAASRLGESDFAVSLIDNAHARAAGLAGYHGVLSVTPTHLVLRDPFLEEVRMRIDWRQLHQCHVSAATNPSDENRICVLHTSSAFCAGAGQLVLWCGWRAPRLVQRVVSRGWRPPQRLLSSPLPTPPSAPPSLPAAATAPASTAASMAGPLVAQSAVCAGLRAASRRLSRSESDLHCCWAADDRLAGSPQRAAAVLLRTHSGSRDSGVRVSTASDDSSTGRGKVVASSLISAGLGLMFSTPGCSEVDSESLHEYQQIGSFDSDEEDQDQIRYGTSPRRESGISVASGIYEEIDESEVSSQSHYENPVSLHWTTLMNKSAPLPPPLPPRKRHDCRTICSVRSEETLDDCRPSSRLVSSQVALRYTERHSASCSALSDTEPGYMPMSPRIPVTAAAEEQLYMPMASIDIS